MRKYATCEDLAEVKKDIEDIKDNHLTTIWTAIEFLRREVGNLRWYILGSVGLLAIVITLVQLLT